MIAARKQRPVAPVDGPIDWEDKFHKLSSEHNDLLVAYNEKEDALRKETTKASRLLDEKTALDANEVALQAYLKVLKDALARENIPLPNQPPKVTNRTIPRHKEEIDAISDYQQQIVRLKRQVIAFQEECKQNADILEKKNREIAVLKRTMATRKASVNAHPPKHNTELEIKLGPTNIPHGHFQQQQQQSIQSPKQDANNKSHDGMHSNLLKIANAYKARVSEVEEKIAQLSEENSRLKLSVENVGNKPNNTSTPNNSFADLESKLREAHWRNQQLQTHLDSVTSKSNKQGEELLSLNERVHELESKNQDLRQSLKDLQSEKKRSDVRAEQVDVLTKKVEDLKNENRKLEGKVADLCSSPFISNANSHQQTMAQLNDVQRERDALQFKVEHLQTAAKTHFAALQSMKQEASQLKNDKDDAQRKLEELRLKYNEAEAGKTVLQGKLRLFAGDDGIDIDVLERALTMVKRKSEALDKLPFLEDIDGENQPHDSLHATRKKLHEIQGLNIRLNDEVERLEGMLKMQTSMNKEQQIEIDALKRKKDKEKAELLQKLAEKEDVAKKRADKIQTLEARLRQFVYTTVKGTNKYSKSTPEARILANNEIQIPVDDNSSDNALLQILKIDNLESGNNLMEVWIKSADYRDGTIPIGASTFVVVDFFDYESQTTTVQIGSKPRWDFAARYKIVVDDFLLRYLATDVITFEVNLAVNGDSSLLSSLSVPLAGLLKSRPKINLTNYPLLSSQDNSIVGYCNIELRLALPISELYRLFLEKHPNEKKFIQEVAARHIAEYDSIQEHVNAVEEARNKSKKSHLVLPEEESRLFNEIEVNVVQATNLPLSRDGKPPSAYVSFELLGFPEKITDVVPDNCNPVFKERYFLPFNTADNQLLLLQRSRAQFCLYNLGADNLDVGESKGEDNYKNGFIGECFVSLSDLSEGKAIRSKFSVRNTFSGPSGPVVGQLEVLIRWRNTFRKQREIGPKALSGQEVETLISTFSVGAFRENIVDCVSFLRYINPPKECLKTMQKLRKYAEDIAARDQRSPQQLFTTLFDCHDNPTEPIDENRFVQTMLKAKLDILPDDFLKLFAYIDHSENKHVNCNQLLAILNLNDSEIRPEIQDKLRRQAGMLHDRKVNMYKIFEDCSQLGDAAMLTRYEFKLALKKLGFNLIDEDENYYILNNDDNKQYPGSNVLESDAATIAAHDRLLLNDTRDSKEFEQLSDDRNGRNPKENRVMVHISDTNLRSEQDDNADDLAGNKSDNLRNVSEQKESDNFQNRQGFVRNPGRREDSQYSIAPYNVDNNKAIVPPVDSNEDNNAISSVDKLVSIVFVENIIREAWKLCQGVSAPPNLMQAFKTLDITKTEVVNRQQFAYALSKFPSIQLKGPVLKCCMEYFDLQGDGKSIDYPAFVRFCEYQEPSLPICIENLRSIVFTRDAVLRIRAADKNGTGYLMRPDMLRVLDEIGFGHFSPDIIQQIIGLFEYKIPGQVFYGNFCEYVRENLPSQRYDKLIRQFISLLSKNDPSLSELTLKSKFAEISKDSYTGFSASQFLYYLRQNAINTPKDVVIVLFGQFSKEGQEVSFSSFTSWVRTTTDVLASESRNINELRAIYGALSFADIKRKIQSYFLLISNLEAQGATSMNSRKIADCFDVYYLKKKDPTIKAIPLQAFANAVQRAGFVLCSREIEALCEELVCPGRHGYVNYHDILDWGMSLPDQMLAVNSDGRPKIKNNIRGLIRILEKKLKENMDLGSLFKKYDHMDTGKITPNDFCAIFNELGVPMVTKANALDLATLLEANFSGLIIYRLVLSELEKNLGTQAEVCNIDPIDIIVQKMQERQCDYERLRDAFLRGDPRDTGHVREDVIEAVLRECRIQLSRTEAMALIESIRSNAGQGVLDFNLLLSRVREKLSTSALDGKKNGFASGDYRNYDGKPAINIVFRLRQDFENLIIRGKDFRAEFEKFDADCRGYVSVDHLHEILTSRLNFNITSNELTALSATYRSEKSPHLVNYMHLLQDCHPRRFEAIRLILSDGKGNQVWRILEDLRLLIRSRCSDCTDINKLHRIFLHFARKRDKKSASIEDVVLALRDLNVILSPEIEKAVFECMAIAGGNEMSFSDFIVFVRDAFHDDVVWKFRRNVERSKISIQSIIEILVNENPNQRFLTAAQFSNVMKQCRIDLSNSDISRLMLRFDVNATETFYMNKFILFLRQASTENEFAVVNTPSSTKVVNNDDTVGRMDAVDKSHDTIYFNKLRQRIIDKVDDGMTYNEIFANFDRSGTGAVNVNGIMKGAEWLGITVPMTNARGILRSMSSEGEVNKARFFQRLGIDISRENLALRELRDIEYMRLRSSEVNIDDLIGKIRVKVDKYSTNSRRSAWEILQDALSTFDNNKDGLIGKPGLVEAFESLSCRLNDEEANILISHLDPRNHGIVAIESICRAIYPQSTISSQRQDYQYDLHLDKLESSFNNHKVLRDTIIDTFSRIVRDEKRQLSDFRKIFEIDDIRLTGLVSQRAFSRALVDFGVMLSDKLEWDLVEILKDGPDVRYRTFIDYLQHEFRLSRIDYDRDQGRDRDREHRGQDFERSRDIDTEYRSRYNDTDMSRSRDWGHDRANYDGNNENRRLDRYTERQNSVHK